MITRPRNPNGTFVTRPRQLTEKLCSQCGIYKPTTEFFSEKNGYLGVRGKCKRCLADNLRKYRESKRRLRQPRPQISIEERRARDRAYYQETKDRFAARRKAGNARWRQKARLNPKFRLTQRMRAGVYQSLKFKGKKLARTEQMLGYTFKQLAAHLERQFVTGMSWGNMGKWHIDHIIPVAHFHFTSHLDAEFKACWAMTNLRPLWAQENLRKGGRIGSLL